MYLTWSLDFPPLIHPFCLQLPQSKCPFFQTIHLIVIVIQQNSKYGVQGKVSNMASLEDRITKAENGQTGADPPSSSGTASSVTPNVPGEAQSWADETAAADIDSKPTTVEATKEASSLSKAQTDGAGANQYGESGIYEPSYDVDVKLSDLQKDAANPLYSIKSFEELGL